jgi:hypothetical protein
MLATVSVLAQAPTSGQDRLAIVEHPEAVLIVLADGAGGIAGGALAAEFIVGEVVAAAGRAPLDSLHGRGWAPTGPCARVGGVIRQVSSELAGTSSGSSRITRTLPTAFAGLRGSPIPPW